MMRICDMTLEHLALTINIYCCVLAVIAGFLIERSVRKSLIAREYSRGRLDKENEMLAGQYPSAVNADYEPTERAS